MKKTSLGAAAVSAGAPILALGVGAPTAWAAPGAQGGAHGAQGGAHGCDGVLPGRGLGLGVRPGRRHALAGERFGVAGHHRLAALKRRRQAGRVPGVVGGVGVQPDRGTRAAPRRRRGHHVRRPVGVADTAPLQGFQPKAVGVTVFDELRDPGQRRGAGRFVAQVMRHLPRTQRASTTWRLRGCAKARVTRPPRRPWCRACRCRAGSCTSTGWVRSSALGPSSTSSWHAHTGG